MDGFGGTLIKAHPLNTKFAKKIPDDRARG